MTERESHLIAVSKIDVSSSKDGGSQVFTADRQQLSHRRSHSVAPICEEVSDFRNKERKVISSPKETQHTTPAENVNPLDSGKHIYLIPLCKYMYNIGDTTFQDFACLRNWTVCLRRVNRNSSPKLEMDM